VAGLALTEPAVNVLAQAVQAALGDALEVLARHPERGFDVSSWLSRSRKRKAPSARSYSTLIWLVDPPGSS